MTDSTGFKELEETGYDLAGKVIGASMRVHRALGPGYPESFYVNALCHELSKLELNATREAPVKIRYDGVVIGTHFADLIVDNALIVELSPTTNFTKAEEAQMVSCLTSTGIETGLLLNFSTASLEFRRKSRTSRSSHSVTSV